MVHEEGAWRIERWLLKMINDWRSAIAYSNTYATSTAPNWQYHAGRRDALGAATDELCDLVSSLRHMRLTDGDLDAIGRHLLDARTAGEAPPAPGAGDAADPNQSAVATQPTTEAGQPTEADPIAVKTIAYCGACPLHYMEHEGPNAGDPQCLHPDAEDPFRIYDYEGAPRSAMPGAIPPPPRCPLRRAAITLALTPALTLIHGQAERSAT